MSIEATLARVSAIRQALADPAAVVGSGVTGGTEAPSTGSASSGEAAGETFAQALQQASGGYETQGASAAQASDDTSGLYYDAAQGIDGLSGTADVSSSSETPGARIVAIAESQLGQAEQPPGSNESPAIAEYRTATAGAVPGAPWCAYFASWVARQAGEPIGANGEGAGAVSEVWSWAQQTGRAIVNGPGVVPKPGDLIVFGDEHVGIVRDVLPDGQIQTIEGNYENKVAANVRSPTEATGYVEMN